MKERLQKLLAQANFGSRRASEDLISAGRVRVNGAVATLGDKADPTTDVIEVDGARLTFAPIQHVYIMLNKPKQVLSTDKPHRGDKRETVSDLLGRKDEHLFSIGRLDADSEGLVVMTNDGDMAQKLSHPRYRHTKTYRVEVLGLPTAETIEKWQHGITLEDGLTAPCHVEIVKGNVKGSTLRIVMTEGKKRQIRRVASLLGHPVRKLVRTHIGMLSMGDLEPGQSRELTAKEVMALQTPSPEIKALRAARQRYAGRDVSTEEPVRPQRRSSRSQDAAGDEAPRPRRSAYAETDDDTKPRRRPSRAGRANQDATGDEAKRPVRARKPYPTADEDAPKRPVRARKPAPSDDDAGETKRPVRARKPYTTDDDAPKRPPRARKPAPSDDEAGEAKRPVRARKPFATDDDAPKRPPRARKPLTSDDDAGETKRPPRARKPATSTGSSESGGKTRPPKPFAPFKNRNRKSRPGKDRR